MDAIVSAAEEAAKKERWVSTTINGQRYSLRLLPAFAGFSTALRLAKTLLPALGAFADGTRREQFILPEDDSLFAEVATHLVSQIDKLGVTEILQAMLAQVKCQGKDVDVNEHFRGDIAGFMNLVEFALKENFGDFFTKYLREKGLEIHSLRDKMANLMGNTQPE